MAQKIRKSSFFLPRALGHDSAATIGVSKEMLPLVDKPLIQNVVEEAVNSGIESVVIVTGRGKTAIEDHFDIFHSSLSICCASAARKKCWKQVRAISEMVT